MSCNHLSDCPRCGDIVEALEAALAETRLLAAVRGARLKILRDGMRETEWLHFVRYDCPDAEDWFGEDGVAR